jgi:hypothetical protein
MLEKGSLFIFQCESEENAEHNSEEFFSSCTCMDPETTLQNTDRHKVDVLEYMMCHCHVNYVAE